MIKLIVENNALLRRNLGLFQITETLFPIQSEETLNKLEEDLKTENQMEIVS